LITNAEKKPKSKEPRTYLLERETGLASDKPEKAKPKETALGGHSRHVKQVMQSCW